MPGEAVEMNGDAQHAAVADYYGKVLSTSGTPTHPPIYPQWGSTHLSPAAAPQSPQTT